jgi:site-specific DNA recombinase
MQSDSFSLNAQLHQIKEQAERDEVDIVKVFSDPAQSAYRKKFRPGINAMREAARRGEFKVLYVHKVDRLARRLEWPLEIVHELQELDIIFKAVQQPFDLRTPEGKLLFHMISSLGEFYSDSLSKETNNGKLERSLQGYQNGAVPWGYISQLIGNRKMGVADPEKAPVVVEMFERYSTGPIRTCRLLIGSMGKDFGPTATSHLARTPFGICCATPTTWAKSATAA